MRRKSLGKKIFWICIALIFIFDVWLIARLFARRSIEPPKIESAIAVTSRPKSVPPAAPAQASRKSGQATSSKTTDLNQTAKPAEAKPAEVKPAEKVSTKNIKDLKTALATGLPVILKLGSDSCYPCRLMKPILKELAEEQDGQIVVLDLEINDHQDLARQFEVRLIPTTIFYDRYGRAKGQHVGYLDKEDLLALARDFGLAD